MRSSSALYILCAIIIIALISMLVIMTTAIPHYKSQSPTVYYFYGQGCPHCANIAPFINATIEKYPDVQFVKLEVWYNADNKALQRTLNTQLGITSYGVPEVIVGSQVLIGENQIPEQLDNILEAYA